MRGRRLYGKTDRRIDEWEFRQPYVKDGEPGDRLRAVYEVRLLRENRIQCEGGDKPKISFWATLKEKDTSREVFQLKGKVRIEADTIAELRDKCEADFDSYGPQDWRKLILVAIHRPGTHKNEGKESALHFGFVVLEEAGGRYRTTDDRSYVSRDKTWLIDADEDEIHELPYSEELEAKLLQVRESLELLAERLDGIVADPKKLLSTKFPTFLK